MNSNIDIKVLRGPYGHIWRNQYDTKEFAEFCYDIEMWGCSIIWAQDMNWIVPGQDIVNWSRKFTEYKSLHSEINIAKLIDKAIESYNIKKNLTPSTVKTFEDIIDEL